MAVQCKVLKAQEVSVVLGAQEESVAVQYEVLKAQEESVAAQYEILQAQEESVAVPCDILKAQGESVVLGAQEEFVVTKFGNLRT